MYFKLTQSGIDKINAVSNDPEIARNRYRSNINILRDLITNPYAVFNTEAVDDDHLTVTLSSKENIFFLKNSNIHIKPTHEGVIEATLTPTDYTETEKPTQFPVYTHGYRQDSIIKIYTHTIVRNSSRLVATINSSGTNITYTTISYLDNITYNPTVEPQTGNQMYSLPVTTFRHMHEELTDQIRARYAFFERPRNGFSNIILDSFFPGLMSKYRFDITRLRSTESFPKTSYAISPLVADILNVPRVPIDHLCKFLGYSVRDIKQLLVAVKHKELNFIFAGTGGTGMNTLVWLSELCSLTGTHNLFNKIALFENETIEFSNTFRFPVGLSEYSIPHSNTSKLALAEKYAEKLSKLKVESNTYYLKKSTTHDYTFFSGRKSRTSTVIYGAPSLEIRNELSDIGHFICATHSANDCSIWLNPKQDDSLALETYGLIQLGSFFMNQLRMTIGLLELLASDQSLDESDKHILDYSFNGVPAGPMPRTYNWQITNNAVVFTDDQAAGI